MHHGTSILFASLVGCLFCMVTINCHTVLQKKFKEKCFAGAEAETMVFLRLDYPQEHIPVYRLDSNIREEQEIAEVTSKGDVHELYPLLKAKRGVPLKKLMLRKATRNAEHINGNGISNPKINCIWMLFGYGLKIVRMPSWLRDMMIPARKPALLMLLHAAGLEVHGLDGDRNTLEKCCRHTIRECMRSNSLINLYYQIPLLKLPRSIQHFLLFEVDLQTALLR